MRDGPDDPLELQRALAAVLHGVLGRSAEPARVGRYRLIEHLGEGAMGTVWVAEDEQIGRRVAIKRLAVGGEASRTRLRKEARALARLSHPNVVQIFEVTHEGEHSFVVMELARGPTLLQWQQTPRAWQQVMRVYLGAGQGLAAAHAQGIVHRDFKPSNVVVTDGDVAQVLDFGLARAASLGGGPTGESGSRRDDDRHAETTVAGTPAYMAPEQRDRSCVDARADQYSFCMALHEALVGRPDGDAIASVAADSPPPRRVLTALARGLADDPAQRWPSMQALLTELRRGLAPRRRGRWIGGIAVGVAVAATAGATLIPRQEAPDDACADELAQVKQVWSDAVRSQVSSALVHSERPGSVEIWSRVDETIKSRVSAWIERREPLCFAPPVGAEQAGLLDCLADRRQRIGELVRLLTEGEVDTLEGALDAAFGLPSIASCDDHAEESLDTEQRAIELRLITAGILERAGKYDAALAEVERLEQVLREENVEVVPPALIRLKAILLQLLGHNDEAREKLQACYWAATEQGLSLTAARCAAWMIRLEGQYRGDVAAARRWEGHAKTALARYGGQPEVQLQIVVNMGGTLESAGQPQVAMALYEDGLEVLRREGQQGRASAELVRLGEIAIMANLALVYGQEGQLSRSRTMLADVLDKEQALLGARHPATATTLFMMAMMEMRGAEQARAIELFERARDIAADAYPPTHPMFGKIELNVGVAYAETDRPEAARKSFARAAELITASLGDDHPLLGLIEANLGNLAYEAGDFDQARLHSQRSLDVLRATYGDEHPDVAEAHHSLAEIAVAQHRCEDAVPQIERAIEISTQTLGAEHERTLAKHRTARDVDECSSVVSQHFAP